MTDQQPPWGPQDQPPQPGQPQPTQPGPQQPWGQQWQPQPGQPWQPQKGPQQPWGQPPWQPGGPQYQQPYPGGMPSGSVKPPKKRHRVRNVILAATGTLVAFVVIGTALSAGSKGTHSSGSSGTVVTQVSPSATASSASFTAAETKWFNDVNARWPQISGGTEAQIVSVGNQLCSARAAGATQQMVIGASLHKFGGKAGAFVRNIERDLCPSEVPAAPQVLLVMSGSGIRNSAPFLVSTSQVTVTYTFDCSAVGGSGNFIADLNYGNQASLNSDSQSIANDLAASGGQTTTVYPQDPGQQYYVAVNSECNWTVKVVAD